MFPSTPPWPPTSVHQLNIGVNSYPPPDELAQPAQAGAWIDLVDDELVRYRRAQARNDALRTAFAGAIPLGLLALDLAWMAIKIPIEDAHPGSHIPDLDLMGVALALVVAWAAFAWLPTWIVWVSEQDMTLFRRNGRDCCTNR